jgi:hypothetical protein
MAVEAALEYARVPVRVPDAELAERLAALETMAQRSERPAA